MPRNRQETLWICRASPHDERLRLAIAARSTQNAESPAPESPMNTRWTSAILAWTLSGCTGGGSQTVDKSDTDVIDTDVVDTDDTDVIIAEFGRDDRPANPTCLAVPRPEPVGSIDLEQVFSGISLQNPLKLAQPPGDESYLYAALQNGRVARWENNPSATVRETVLNIRSQVKDQQNEQGLLGIAFHPDFVSNGELYLNYTASCGGSCEETVISRVTSADGGASFDPASEEVILTINQPAWNHNGGNLDFGPDGYLYIGTGDGGQGNDPWNNAQNTDVLLGKMLRIDVDGGTPYAIPSDNPFAAGGGAAEIFAWGIRNPFRFAFDPVTGDLWVGDVGQDAREEVTKVELGGNYGWKNVEGFKCNTGDCSSPDFIDPIVDYAHQGFGSRSVIGGTVYRGGEVPELYGTYLFSEFYTGQIFGVYYNGVTGDAYSEELIRVNGSSPVMFYSTEVGEVYVLDYDGTINKRVADAGSTGDTFPQLLSETGCGNPDDPTEMVEAAISYNINMPLWSDDLDKKRWMALPDGTTIEVNGEGDWDFPVGTVLIKEFSHNGERIETRLLMRHDDGAWAGYAYRWNDDLTDAVLVPTGQQVDLGSFLWQVPDSATCFACHGVAITSTLGPKTEQLNGDALYTWTGRRAPQIDTLNHLGMFATSPGDPSTLPAFPALGSDAPAEDQARAYLDANCAPCHQPGGSANAAMDLRHATPLPDMNLCDVEPDHGDLGVSGAKLLVPGDPSSSLVYLRADSTAPEERMPPAGTVLVHSDGVDVIADWISGLTGCP